MSKDMMSKQESSRSLPPKRRNKSSRNLRRSSSSRSLKMRSRSRSTPLMDLIEAEQSKTHNDSWSTLNTAPLGSSLELDESLCIEVPYLIGTERSRSKEPQGTSDVSSAGRRHRRPSSVSRRRRSSRRTTARRGSLKVKSSAPSDATKSQSSRSRAVKETTGNHVSSRANRRHRMVTRTRRDARHRARETKALLSLLDSTTDLMSSDITDLHHSIPSTKVIQFDATQTNHLSYIELDSNPLEDDSQAASIASKLQACRRQSAAYDFLEHMLEPEDYDDDTIIEKKDTLLDMDNISINSDASSLLNMDSSGKLSAAGRLKKHIKTSVSVMFGKQSKT